VPVADDLFGTAFVFDGENDNIDLATLTCPASFTFALYICPDAASLTRDAPLLEFGQQAPQLSLAYGRLKLFWGPSVDSSSTLTAGTWYHVAATYDATTRKAQLYINGELLKSGDFNGTLSGLGLGIAHRFTANWFGGRMRHVMIFGEALSQDVLRQIIVTTGPREARHVPPLTRPGVGLFSMDLVNDDDQPLLYLEDSQKLSLSVENTWGGDIELVETTEPVGPDCCHFQLQFRQGTLRPSFRDELIAGQGEAIGALNSLGWTVHCKDLETGGDLVSLLWGGSLSDPSATPPRGLLKSKARLLLPLVGVSPDLGAGSRTSRVLMRYDRMLLPDRTSVPRGQRIELLNILARPRQAPGSLAGVVASLLKHQITVDGKLPLEIKVAGGASLLNDGGPNTITFTLKNIRRNDEAPAQLELGTGLSTDATPKIYLSLDRKSVV